MANSLPLAVTMGDPAGCGPKITEKAWKSFRQQPDTRPFYVISSPDLYQSVPTERIDKPSQAIDIFQRALPVLPVADFNGYTQPGTPDSKSAPAIIGSIETAVRHVLSGNASAVITNPVSKALLYGAGFRHPGHTEFISELCRRDEDAFTPKPIMMLVGGGLRVALATIHVPLKDVPTLLTNDLLVETARIVAHDLKVRYGLDQPRLAFTGLNPHAGESGAIGREEIDIINPAAESLRLMGIDISNARPADTVFHEALQGQFDAVIAMTHDQGLIPVKTLDMWGGVNTTLGLPIIRTSPDHGTAYDAAARGDVRADSLIASIKLAAQMVEAKADA